jgi:hypothetical protein
MARPSFKPTAAQRRKVAVAAGAGMAHEQIALGLGITKPTLYKYFEQELTAGAAEKKMEALVALHAAAKRGNSAAVKAYLALGLGARPAGAPPDAPKEGAQAPQARLGKKEVAQQQAAGAADGTEWAGLLPTPGIVQ